MVTMGTLYSVTAREKFIDNVNLFGKADCGASGKSLGYV